MALARTGVEVEVEVDVDFDRADDGFDAVVARLPVVDGRRGADPAGRGGAAPR
ncbi:MAG: hypothetical protein M3501_02775 [Actinomycetota bacterium]|nr:hypothetical protein [Actinomycetota bacterium]MDQ3350875.1 hypothetical protein [Actinomycetota bacterium]